MEKLEKEVQRWKILGLVGLAFGAGMFVQQFGNANAQAGVGKVRLDTSNCAWGLVTSSSGYNIPSGALLMQVLRQGSSTSDTAWVYNVCK